MDSNLDYDFDHEFDLGPSSTGPDIYGDNVDFNLEDSLVKDEYSTTQQQHSSELTLQNIPSLAQHNSQNYHMTHQLPPKPHETPLKTEPLENVYSISTVDRRGSHKDPARHEAGKIFIGGLNWETTDESLRAHFSRWGEILDCSVMKEPVTGKSRGFGFLTYVDPKVITKMLEEEHVLDGKIVDPKRAIPREEQERTEKIFVGGISPDVTEEEFSDFFAQFGSVIDATLMMDRDTGRPRGFGFITFEDDMKVDELVARNDLTIKGKVVEVKRAMPKHKAQAAKQAKDMGYGGGAMIPTFVSDARTASMGKAGNGLGVPMVPTAGRAGAYGANPAAAAAAMYGAGAMGMNAGAAAAKNWMAAAAGMYGAGAAGYGNPGGAGAAGATGGFYGFPPGAANYAGMYNPAAVAAYYQRLAASGFANWGAAAAAAGAVGGGGRAGWYQNAGGNGGNVGGYDMYGGSNSSSGVAGGYGMGMMVMGGSGTRAMNPAVKTERERESVSRDPRQRSSRSRSPRRDQDHSPRRRGSDGRDYRPTDQPSHAARRTSNAGGASGAGSGRGGRYEPY